MAASALVLIGPSGAGKSTLLRALSAELPDLRTVRTLTTRPRRPGETSDTHEFVSAAEFAERKAAALGVHRHYGHDYALPRLEAGPGVPVATCLRAVVLDRLRSLHPDLYVVAAEAPVPELLRRLGERGDRERAEPEVLQAELEAGRQLADLVLDTREPVADCLARIREVWP
ncbi:AAA family ATPase [Microlunatus sp. GCM10028923]|uniref:AAA family ATPase n=1 Tax=Microlunatus sp. GCM10028923 TaxID=3273400 RepID=UPI00361991AD